MIPRKTKYGNKKDIVDGIKFDSKLESRRYGMLKVLERVGKISDLKLQVPFSLEVNGQLVCKYIADFVYNKDGVQVVEDSKGAITREFSIKRKLMKACYGIDILYNRKPDKRTKEVRSKKVKLGSIDL